ncbi:MAG: hypothetical protein ACRDX9_05135 [Acidimicrobiia bacterium]
MSGRIGSILLLVLMPSLAAAQDPKAPTVNKVPAIEPLAPLTPDTTKSADAALHPGTPLEEVSDGSPLITGATNDLRVVRIDPPTGNLIASDGTGVWTRENGIWVTLAYEVNTVSRARLDALVLTSAASGGLTSHRTYLDPEYPERHVTGSGVARIRISISCDPDSPGRIRDLRLAATMRSDGSRTPLVRKEQSLPHTLRCISGPGPVVRQDERIPPRLPEGPPAAAKPSQRIQPRDRPVSPPAAAPIDEVAHPTAPSIDPRVGEIPPPVEIDPGVVEGIGACTDPATVDLSPRLVGRTDPSRGVGIIEIVGTVRNVGRAAYVSEPAQQGVKLVEEQPGTPPRIVADQTFTLLAPNRTVRLVHRRSWDTAIEFQPRYRLRITYEPDIRTDANPRNDDCRLDNNEAVLEPERINALFR